MKRTKKLVLSFLLSMALMVLTIVGMPAMSAKAEGEEVVPNNEAKIIVAGKKNAGKKVGNEWYYNDGYTELSSGMSVSQGSGDFENKAKAKFTYGEDFSTLELSGYKTNGQVGYEKDGGEGKNDLYGIYYDGNLKLVLHGENSITTDRTNAYHDVYGIYVTGDLIIEGDGTLNLCMQNQDGMTVNDSKGIVCEGKLTVSGASVSVTVNYAGSYCFAISCHDYEQNAGEVNASAHNGKYVRGVFAEGYEDDSVRMTGGNLSILSDNGEDYVHGLCVDGGLFQSGGTITSVSHGSYQVRGVCSEIGTIVVTGGSLYGKAYGSSYTCEGICSYFGLLLPENSTAEVTGVAGYGEEQEKVCRGISIARGDVTILGGTVTAKADKADWYSLGTEVIGNVTVGGTGKLFSYAQQTGIYAHNFDCRDDAEVRAESGKHSVGRLSGIELTEELRMSGGTIYAKGGDDRYVSFGIETTTCLVSGGEITCEGENIGISVYDTFKLTDGKVIAKGKGFGALSMQDYSKLIVPQFEGSTKIDGSDPVISTSYDKKWKYAVLSFPPTGGTIWSASATFKGMVELNFYCEVQASVLSDEEAYVTLTQGSHESVKILLKNIKETKLSGHKVRRFTYPVVAKEMRDDVVLRLYDGNGNLIPLKSGSGTYYGENGCAMSVITYCDLVVNNSTDEKMIELAKAVKDYGTAAQKYFGYNAEDLSVRYKITKLDVSVLNPYAAVKTGDRPAGFAGNNLTLAFESDSTLRLYYLYNEGVGAGRFSYKVDDAKATIKKFNGKNCLEVQSIAARDLDLPHTFSITLGKKTETVQVSALTYAYMLSQGSANKQKNLGKALYLYNQAAKAYFGK